jgi:1,4-alpha-glucan branching enzyme
MSPRPSPVDELGLYLFNEGTHRRIEEMLGAHPDEEGCWFAVWAPAARAVQVVGDFDGWGDAGDSRDGHLEPQGPSGSGVAGCTAPTSGSGTCTASPPPTAR